MKSKPELSIIIPCFNCEQTVQETVQSLLGSRLDAAYEVIFVDDGSTDTTPTFLPELSRLFQHSSVLTHQTNRGGGAARNTGIQQAQGSVVFCLDSDNLLSPDSLAQMLTFLHENQLDGVAFHKRKYFYGKNHFLGSTHENPLTHDSYTLNQLFDGSNVLLDNFLMTKEAYLRVGGYTTSHDFDTQEFEMLFLSHGLKVMACPDTLFFHRQRGEQKSYFERVFERGEYSLNYYLIFEKIFRLFSASTQKEIIGFDLWQRCSLEDNLLLHLTKLYRNAPRTFFREVHQQMLGEKELARYEREHKESSKIEDLWCSAMISLQQKHFDTSLSIWLQIGKQFGPTALVQWNIMRTVLHIQFFPRDISIEKESLQLLNQMQLHGQTNNLRQPLYKLAIGRVFRLLR